VLSLSACVHPTTRPDKLSKIDDLLGQFHGKEDKLLQKMRKKYHEPKMIGSDLI
jgi:hypothetical protein